MSRPSTPRAKLPDVNDRKLPQPGPNSWAQSAEKAAKMKTENSGTPTNRDKYENKPIPPLPQTSEDEKSPNAPGKPGYIQPATPLIYSKPTPGKNRSVTDPVASKNLFGTNKVSIGELRRKFSGTKNTANLSSVEEIPKSGPQDPRQQAAELPTGSAIASGSYEKQHENPPASAPPSTNAPDPFRSSGTQGRLHQSSPAPTRRYLKENNLPDPPLIRTSPNLSAYAHLESTTSDIKNHDGMIFGDGKLNPTRNGTYGTVGEVEYVEGQAAHRVASFVGVIEDVASSVGSEHQKQPQLAGIHSSPDSAQGQNITHLLQPNIYSPSEYGGVWENDPHVGHTLPPFSPMGHRRPFQPELQHKNSSLGSRDTVPMVLHQGQYGQSSRLSAYPPSVASTNSWAPQSQEASNPPNSATVPPLFSDQHNAVPPPPLTFRDYQPPSGQVPAELARVELTLHHHLDNCFGSLSRLVTDKHDNTVDHLLRRLESHEKKVEKIQKSLRSDIKDIKQDVECLRSDVRHIQQNNDGFKNSLKNTNVKLDTMSSKLDNAASKSANLDQAFADISAAVREVGAKCDRIGEQARRPSIASEGYQPHNGLSPTRSQSTNASPGLQSQRLLYQSGGSQASGGGRQGDMNSRSRPSNTTSGGAGPRSSDGRGSRRQYYAEIGATMGGPPDLRQHPAYLPPQQQQPHGYDANGLAMGMASDGTLFQIPPLSGHGMNGWYHQAFGQS